MGSSRWAELEESLGYVFFDRALLERAFCHSSFANEAADEAIRSNEQLEFLGDAVLELAVTSLIYERSARYGYSEGILTAVRAQLVRTSSLAAMARKLGLGRWLKLGRGAEKNGERENDTVLEDTFEALVGAIYLDGTAAHARLIVRRLFEAPVDAELRTLGAGERYFDYKTTLQIELQRGGVANIRYETVSESGPDHDKTFVVHVLLDGEWLGEGKGKTKKTAEQAAAKAALQSIGIVKE
ncbi:MAG: ribonuclease III [Clostridiales Family XIII bacterium]|nr:ribonuclease III [Clostridiales Family XIII bacterium]